jgi:hypothetical protein
MKRTQIYLTEDLYEAVRRLSYDEHRSMADVIREAVAVYLTHKEGGAQSAGLPAADEGEREPA